MDYNFIQEEKELVEFYLESDLFREDHSFDFLNNTMKNPDGIFNTQNHLLEGIEIIVRPECNQKCEYCYITRYGKDLYPLHNRLSNEQILQRIDMLLNYVFNTRGMFINHWELFAGDLFYDDLAFDIFDIFYKYVDEIYNKYRRIVSNPDNEGLILMPTNFSFIDDDEKAHKVEQYIKKFRERNWELGFSVSTDGPSAVDTREQRELSADHFDKLFKWTKKYPRNGFHPIISASNVKNSIENYKWWKESYQKWYHDLPEKGILPYWLEARNDEWTPEAIKDYLALLDYMLQDRLEMCDNDIDKLAYHLFKGDGLNGTLPSIRTNDLINLKIEHHPVERQITQCSLTHLLCINLSNLEVVPCHRLTYPQFTGFKFECSENQIVDLIPKNMSGFLTTVLHGENSRPKCASCIFQLLCHKGCLGAQYESSGELFQPAISVCELSQSYCKFLIEKYHTMGLLKSAKKQNLLTPLQDIVYGEILIQQLHYSPEEVYSQ